MTQANQFTDPAAPRTIPILADKPRAKTLFAEWVYAERLSAESCYVPDQLRFSATLEDGSRMYASTRSLLYYRVYGGTPTFGVPTCGNRGCCNPHHQKVFEVAA